MNFVKSKCFLNVIILTWCYVTTIRADKPCAARRFSSSALVCVCNSTYCDEIIRESPAAGTFVSYTSSKNGLRFNKTIGDMIPFTKSKSRSKYSVVLELDVGKTFQNISGFGGAVTDAAAINWKNLSDTVLQELLIDSYFSEKGLEYNMIRTPIGGSDFSTHPYAFNELPENDTKLTNYSLTIEDLQYKIPMIKASMAAATSPIHIVATTWSPPVWMKTNHKITGYSRLSPEYYQTYADYHYKFLEKYASHGIPIWAITTTNEPLNGVVPIIWFNSLGWGPSDMGKWIVENLGPTIRNSTFKDLKILAVDDQRYTIPLWFNVLIREHPKALDVIDGVAVHYYGDFITPSSVLSLVSENHPRLFVLATEACEGSFPYEFKKVDLGSWQRAVSYVRDIIDDLTHNVVGWIDWNLCLNAEGGPNWAHNFVDAPIIVFPENKEFYKQPMFYALGHFSKFVSRASQRIDITPLVSAKGVEYVAFKTPKKTVVIVMYNGSAAKDIKIKINNRQIITYLEADSITTIEFSV